MPFFIKKTSSYFFPVSFVRATKNEHDKVQLKQKEAFTLLDKYDKGEIKIDYSSELKKLKAFALANK